jgi:hypothetical protein
VSSLQTRHHLIKLMQNVVTILYKIHFFIHCISIVFSSVSRYSFQTRHHLIKLIQNVVTSSTVLFSSLISFYLLFSAVLYCLFVLFFRFHCCPAIFFHYPTRAGWVGWSISCTTRVGTKTLFWPLAKTKTFAKGVMVLRHFFLLGKFFAKTFREMFLRKPQAHAKWWQRW